MESCKIKQGEVVGSGIWCLGLGHGLGRGRGLGYGRGLGLGLGYGLGRGRGLGYGRGLGLVRVGSDLRLGLGSAIGDLGSRVAAGSG